MFCYQTIALEPQILQRYLFLVYSFSERTSAPTDRGPVAEDPHGQRTQSIALLKDQKGLYAFVLMSEREWMEERGVNFFKVCRLGGRATIL